MRRFSHFVGPTALMLLLGGGFATGCRPVPEAVPAHPDPSAFTGSNALAEVVEFLALGPRDGGTPGSAKAARYLADRLTRSGAQVEFDRFPDRAPDGTSVFHNVIGRLPGTTDRIVIVGAHFDTKAGIPGFQGANDSGSGVGVLLALADWFRAAPGPKPTLWLAFFDGEECRHTYGPHDGLHGSRRLAHLIVDRGLKRKVQAVVVLDMIGDRNLSVMIPRNVTPGLASAVLKAASAEGSRETFGLFRGGILDDHQPFLEAGLPAVVLIDFEYGSSPGRNDYWHTAEDTLDKLSAESLGLVGRVAIRLINDLAAQTASGDASSSAAN